MKAGRELTAKQTRIIAWAVVAAFTLIIAVGCWFVGRPMLRFAQEPDIFRAWVESHGIWGPLLYMGMVILQILAAIIPGEPLEIAGGYAFGALWGTVLCLAASALGSAAVFALVRRFGTRLVEALFPQKDIQALRVLQLNSGRWLLFMIIFMLPGTPKDLMCYFAGLTDIKFSTMMLICSLGRIPAIISSTLGGNALGTERYIMAAVVFAGTLLISGLGVLFYRHMLKKRGEEKEYSETNTPAQDQ